MLGVRAIQHASSSPPRKERKSKSKHSSLSTFEHSRTSGHNRGNGYLKKEVQRSNMLCRTMHARTTMKVKRPRTKVHKRTGVKTKTDERQYLHTKPSMQKGSNHEYAHAMMKVQMHART